MNSQFLFALMLSASFLQNGVLSQKENTEGDGALGVLDFFAPKPKKEICPPIPVTQNFKVEQYMGRWYEIERFESPFQSGDCNFVEYDYKSNGSFTVVKHESNRGKTKSTEGTATPSTETGRFHVKLPDIPEGNGSPNYNVVLTDYGNFAVIYTCEPVGFSDKFEFAWIMGRRPQLPEKFLILLKNRLKNIGIKPEYFNKTKQTDCERSPTKRT